MATGINDNNEGQCPDCYQELPGPTCKLEEKAETDIRNPITNAGIYYKKHPGTKRKQFGPEDDVNFVDLAICPVTGDIFLASGKDIYVWNPSDDWSKNLFLKSSTAIQHIVVLPSKHVAVTGLVYVRQRPFVHHRVQVYDEHAALVREFGSETQLFNHPHGICYHNDHFYIADHNNQRVRVFREGGEAMESIHLSMLMKPDLVVINKKNELYVTCFHEHQIFVFDTDRQEMKTTPRFEKQITDSPIKASLVGSDRHKLKFPFAMCLDGSDNVLVVSGDGRQWWIDVFNDQYTHLTRIVLDIKATTMRGIDVTREGDIVLLTNDCVYLL